LDVEETEEEADAEEIADVVAVAVPDLEADAVTRTREVPGCP